MTTLYDAHGRPIERPMGFRPPPAPLPSPSPVPAPFRDLTGAVIRPDTTNVQGVAGPVPLPQEVP